MRFLFWNTKKNSINQAICDLVQNKCIDFIALAEYKDDIDALCKTLGMAQYVTAGCDRIVMLGNSTNVTPGNQHSKYSIQIIGGEYIICATHLPSNLSPGGSDSREIVVQSMVNAVLAHEETLNTDKTIVFGDLNEDPFDVSCIKASKLHGLSCYAEAKRGKRIVMGETFRMFYNPMWSFFGDRESPPGTYYYQGSTDQCIFWHIYDQVLIRPSLKPEFNDKKLEIVTSINNQSLLDHNGHPKSKEYSDHLPIIFEIGGARI